jgi:hypothetical protein
MVIHSEGTVIDVTIDDFEWNFLIDFRFSLFFFLVLVDNFYHVYIGCLIFARNVTIDILS